MATFHHDMIGPFQILRLLGVGGMAQVYHAVDRNEGVAVVVALKVPHQHIVMDKAARSTFLREARLVAEMGSHPNIVHVSRVGVDGGLPYMVMEYITGLDLAKLCKTMRAANQQWSEPAILWVLASIIQGLKHAWGAEVANKPLRIVHRDITPSNIMLTYEGYVKIGDFGIAQQVGKENSGSIRGKCRYMPVEQLQGRATTASDMYAVGAIGWELIEGKRFRGDKKTDDEMLLAAFNGERPDITRNDVSRQLLQFIHALLNPNEKIRIQNPTDAWARLRACPGVNLVDPEPVQILLRDSLGRRRSGCTDVEVVVVHPELAATRAALAAAAKNRQADASQQREADAPQQRRRASTPAGPTIKLETDEAPSAQTTTVVLPEPAFPSTTPPAAALARPISNLRAADPQSHRPVLTQPAPFAPVPTQPSLPTATLPLLAAPPSRHKFRWFALGIAGLLLAIAALSVSKLLAAFTEPDESTIGQNPRARPVAELKSSKMPTPHTTPTASTDLPAPLLAAPVDGPPRTKKIPATPVPAKSGPETPAPRLLEPKSKNAPKPKAKPRTTVLVRLGTIGTLDLRIGSKVRHITGDTTLRLRAGSKRFAVRRPNTTGWYSDTKRIDPGKEYLLRLYAERFDLIQLSGETNQ